MSNINRKKNQHLLWRAGFGPMAENIAQLNVLTQKELWQKLVTTSADVPAKINLATNPFSVLKNGNEEGETMKPIDKEDAISKKILNQKYRDELKDMNIAWLNQMIHSKAQLREKMAFFWHGHFACRSRNAFFAQELLNIIKEKTLGNFGDMLRAVSKSPAMLQFLNNQQNRKGKPNENFAREVMELFTLGRGNYTENDIKESARAFTGWTFNKNGQFAFKQKIHDDGVKSFLGQTGNFNGDDIIDILLKQKQTATFITKKIYKYFVYEKIDDTKIDYLSTRFFKNNYNILNLLTDIFTSTWFYNDKNIGTKIKSPIELLVGLRRYLPLQMDNEDSQLLFQKVLGQTLFYPPNVAGWPGGKNWIDSSTLMLRLQIPKNISNKDIIDIKPKDDDDTNMGMKEEKKIAEIRKPNGASSTINWDLIIKNFEEIARPQLLETIEQTLLQTKTKVDDKILSKYLNNDSRENFIKSVVINVMSTPEYQMC
ncbi:MAG: DUF1800 domain-containing protein [Ferruginibacter sp.]